MAQKKATKKAAPKKAAAKKPAKAPDTLPTQPDDTQATVGAFVEFASGPHEGRYGVLIEAHSLDNAIVRTRDDASERLVGKYTDLVPAESGRPKMPSPVEIMRLRQAVEQFQGRAPKNLHDGVMDKLKEVMDELGQFDPSSEDSPGKREARALAPGTDGTGEHFRKAARGIDGPSPGQREARNLSSDIETAAREIAGKVNG